MSTTNDTFAAEAEQLLYRTAVRHALGTPTEPMTKEDGDLLARVLAHEPPFPGLTKERLAEALAEAEALQDARNKKKK